MLNCNNTFDNLDKLNNQGYKVSCKWKPEKKEEYVQCINSYEFTNDINKIKADLLAGTDKQTVDKSIKALSEIITTAGDGHIKVSNHKFGRVNKKKRKSKPWFNLDCKHQRDIFFENVRQYKYTNVDEHRINMSNERSKYRKLCRLKQQEYIGRKQ